MTTPVRVLQVLGVLDRGGAETAVLNLYRAVDRTRVQFDFVCHSAVHGAFTDEILALGGRVYRAPAYTGVNHLAYTRWWNAFFVAHPEYRLIHAHVRSTASIFLMVARRHGLVTIAHSHSTSSGVGFRATMKDLLQLGIRQVADYFFACSTEAGEWLFGSAVCAGDRFFLVPNAITVDRFVFDPVARSEVRRELGLTDKFVVGHVGSFSRAKNHRFLVQVFEQVHRKQPSSVLLLAGEGGLRPDIERQIRACGLTGSTILAGVRTDVNRLLQAMDVLVFPSLHEGLPVALVEAQASGLKVLASASISSEVRLIPETEFLDLKAGVDAWADAALAWSEGYVRRNTSAEVAAAGYDIHSVAKWLSGFYMDKVSQQSVP